MRTDGYSKIIFELSRPGKAGFSLPEPDVALLGEEDILPEGLRRQGRADLPSVSEPEAVRHYTRLSRLNYDVDGGMYPLGSCTMKYNPRIGEEAASNPAFSGVHPLAGDEDAQGTLEMMAGLEERFRAITGMDAFSLSPAAGAHGELAGLMIIRAWHEKRGDFAREKIIVPDSSHGTNPASASMAGMKVVSVATGPDGLIDLEALKAELGEDVAGVMLTNPNTLGLFETGITDIAGAVHACGALLYCDGANMNALMGIARPGDMGFDVMHLNVHKTFAAPHGGGGPGAGPVGVKAFLAPFLPGKVVTESGGAYSLRVPEDSVGPIRGWFGSVDVLVKAWAYISCAGSDGLTGSSENAVINANYLKTLLAADYRTPFPQPCMHEFVLDGLRGKSSGIHAGDIAKRLIDYGFHPPTVYFPLIVPQALMIEPVETEDKAEIDAFAAAMAAIAREAREDPGLVSGAPHSAPVSRADDTLAAKRPVLTHAQALKKGPQ